MIISASFSPFFLFVFLVFFFGGGKETLEGNFMFFLLQLQFGWIFSWVFFMKKVGFIGSWVSFQVEEDPIWDSMKLELMLFSNQIMCFFKTCFLPGVHFLSSLPMPGWWHKVLIKQQQILWTSSLSLHQRWSWERGVGSNPKRGFFQKRTTCPLSTLTCLRCLFF